MKPRCRLPPVWPLYDRRYAFELPDGAPETEQDARPHPPVIEPTPQQQRQPQMGLGKFGFRDNAVRKASAARLYCLRRTNVTPSKKCAVG